MIIAFSVAPTETPNNQAEMSEAVSAAIKIVRESGLPNETNAMFMSVIKRATDAVLEVSPRVSLVLKADIRPGYTNQITAKVESVERHLSQ